ncbi:fluoride efflux transporter CrcB [Flavobacterium sp.]|uniref:fluoride efflux transporter CrcB n=1 Tax=Flavobacterium sp. TaxID=239 RepID=UPI0026283406|nr:fluoride efflux transporter CrcB [Flavobacterium sp.]
MLKSILLVGVGGAAGSMLRYLTALLVNRYANSHFPWATFTVNVLGCFLIGLLFGLLDKQQIANQNIRLLLITGFCGGYTTFSAFSIENLSLLQGQNSLVAFAYMAASIIAGLAAVWLGLIIAR